MQSQQIKNVDRKVLLVNISVIPLPAPVTPGPTLAPLTFSCQAKFSPDSNQLSISCSSSRENSTLDIVCFLDDIAQTDGCELYMLTVSLTF